MAFVSPARTKTCQTRMYQVGLPCVQPTAQDLPVRWGDTGEVMET